MSRGLESHLPELAVAPRWFRVGLASAKGEKGPGGSPGCGRWSPVGIRRAAGAGKVQIEPVLSPGNTIMFSAAKEVVGELLASKDALLAELKLLELRSS